jgi:polyisoprenoid-binding protein YceI
LVYDLYYLINPYKDLTRFIDFFARLLNLSGQFSSSKPDFSTTRIIMMKNKSSKLQAWGLILIVSTLMLAACVPVLTEPLATSSSPTAVSGAAAAATTAPTAAVAAATDTASPTAAATAAPSAPAASATAAPAAASSGAVKYEIVTSGSTASYAVREQLANLNLPSDAIGKTSAVSGSISVNADGTIDSANSKITVDVSTLQTDSSMRDNFVARNVLQSDQYPQAVFVAKQVSGLPKALPQSGNVAFKLTGDLTIRNVTKSVTWDVSGSIANGKATGTATTSFTFEDFTLSQPRVGMVLSVADKIALTVTVELQPAG